MLEDDMTPETMLHIAEVLRQISGKVKAKDFQKEHILFVLDEAAKEYEAAGNAKSAT